MNLLSRLKNSSLLINTSWMLASEGMSRATRLVTIIVLAAYLTSADYGTAMLALAFHEILRVIMRAGAGPKVIQCAENELPTIARNAASLQWIICLGLCIIQLVSAHFIAAFYDNEKLAELLQIMALSYIFYPLVSLRVFLLQRQGKIRYFSLASGSCVMIENLSCAIFLFFDFGLTSVAMTKIMAAVAWVIIFYFSPVKSYGIGFNLKMILKLGQYSGSILGIETMRVLRSQLDLTIAGRLLSPEMFGIYSFAKSAGVGLSQSLSAAYISVLYPHICKLQRNPDKAQKDAFFYLISLAICAIFIVQAVISPIYIEWLFASQWHSSADIVSVLCLSAIPALLIDTECSLLRARNRIDVEFLLSIFCVFISLAGLLMLSPISPMEFAEAVCVTALFWLTGLCHRFIQSNPNLAKRVSV